MEPPRFAELFSTVDGSHTRVAGVATAAAAAGGTATAEDSSSSAAKRFDVKRDV